MTSETKVLGGVLAATILIIVGGAFFMGSRGATAPAATPVADLGRLVHDEDPAFAHTKAGKASDFADAKVTFVEFGDFQCPTCGAVFPLVEGLKQTYADKSVRFVWRQFPLTANHQFAELAAEASLAAHAQGKFWDYHHRLFENQEHLTRDDLVKYADLIGLDVAVFTKALDEHTYAAAVQNDINDGHAVGVAGTPTIFINGLPYTGRYSLSDFQAAIDAALAK